MPKGNWREFNNAAETVGTPKSSCEAKSKSDIRVLKTKAGKGGKTVTVINGLELDHSKTKLLLKKLKSNCGTGGTIKGEALELQGDQVDEVMDILRTEGLRPKRAGG